MRQFFLIVCICSLVTASFAADHKEAPLIQEDPAADINDVYAFADPADNSKLVMILTVNPFSVPGIATTSHFAPEVRYRFLIDNDGNATPDHIVVVRFSQRSSSGQTFTAELPGGATLEGQVTLPTVALTANQRIIAQGPNGVLGFAGPADDPFFFDVTGFSRIIAGIGTFSGVDTFRGFNISAIDLSLPFSAVAGSSPTLQIWADTARQRITVRRTPGRRLEVSRGPWQIADRMGVPAVSTALIPSSMKDGFNQGQPVDDASDYSAPIVASLQGLGTTAANIGILGSVAIPDTLKLDPSQPPGFPNGRRLEDDVIDTILFYVYNQTTVSDQVNANDVPFETTFPYLALPHQPE